MSAQAPNLTDPQRPRSIQDGLRSFGLTLGLYAWISSLLMSPHWSEEGRWLTATQTVLIALAFSLIDEALRWWRQRKRFGREPENGGEVFLVEGDAPGLHLLIRAAAFKLLRCCLNAALLTWLNKDSLYAVTIVGVILCASWTAIALDAMAPQSKKVAVSPEAIEEALVQAQAFGMEAGIRVLSEKIGVTLTDAETVLKMAQARRTVS